MLKIKMTNQPLLEVRDLQTVFELDEGTVKAVDGVTLMYIGEGWDCW